MNGLGFFEINSSSPSKNQHYMFHESLERNKTRKLWRLYPHPLRERRRSLTKVSPTWLKTLVPTAEPADEPRLSAALEVKLVLLTFSSDRDGSLAIVPSGYSLCEVPFGDVTSRYPYSMTWANVRGKIVGWTEYTA